VAGSRRRDQARADLADLIDWIGAVYRRYPGGALRSCWLWHPTVVEELWWLRNAHHAAYHGRGACWRDVGDWHDRQRPGAAARINKALSVCELTQHLDSADRGAPDVALARHADQIADTWTTHRTTPEPTGPQLTEADHHDRTEDRGRIR